MKKASFPWKNSNNLHGNRLFLKDQRTAIDNHHDNIDSSLPKRMCTAVVKAINKEIDGLDREIEKIVSDTPEIKHEVEIMTSMPGIGIGTAVVLLCELGSLKNYPTRQKITAVHFIRRLRIITQNIADYISVSIPDSMAHILPLEGQIWLLFLEVRQTYAKHLGSFIHRDQFRHYDR